MELPTRLHPDGPEVIGRTHPDWLSWSQGFAAHADYANNEPLAVIPCASTKDVEKALAWAIHNHLPVRPRAGRHNYQGHSSLVKDGCVIDVSGLRTFDLDSEQRTAVLGAGLSMFELTELLNPHGLGIPYATGSSVGLGGFVLGGGVGTASRLWGLCSDHVLAFTLVGPDAIARPVSPESDPDLYWACLGSGGGNFGIVTEFKVRLEPITNVGLIQATFAWDQFEPVVDAWQRQAPLADRRLTTFMTLRSDKTIRVLGQLTDEQPDKEAVLQIFTSIFKALTPQSLSVDITPQAMASRIFFRASEEAPNGWHNLIKHQLFKSTSAFANGPLPPEALTLLREKIEAHPVLRSNPPEISMVQLLCGGGKIAEAPEYPSATAHRDAPFLLQYDGYWNDPDDCDAVESWTNELRNSLLPWASGAYINYVDDAIPKPERLTAYFGPNAERLQALKLRYDPNRVFSFPHSL